VKYKVLFLIKEIYQESQLPPVNGWLDIDPKGVCKFHRRAAENAKGDIFSLSAEPRGIGSVPEKCASHFTG
jgi:hypothetical protein